MWDFSYNILVMCSSGCPVILSRRVKMLVSEPYDWIWLHESAWKVGTDSHNCSLTPHVHQGTTSHWKWKKWKHTSDWSNWCCSLTLSLMSMDFWLRELKNPDQLSHKEKPFMCAARDNFVSLPLMLIGVPCTVWARITIQQDSQQVRREETVVQWSSTSAELGVYWQLAT